MHRFAVLILIASSAVAQEAADTTPEIQPKLKSRTEAAVPPRHEPSTASTLIVPAGARIPIQLRQPVSTKGAKAGDPIYAQTTFPIVVEGNIAIPAGTWVQGEVDTVKRAGRLKGTAELQFHLTKLIYANGYMLDMTAGIDQVPGDAPMGMKEPGTVKHDSEKGKDLERVMEGASRGGQIGAIAGVAARPSVRGLGVGGLAGMGVGTLIGLLARGSDVTFASGTAVEIALTQAIAVDRQSALKTASAER